MDSKNNKNENINLLEEVYSTFIKGDYIIKKIDGDDADSIFKEFYLNPDYFSRRLISIYNRSWSMGYVDFLADKNQDIEKIRNL